MNIAECSMPYRRGIWAEMEIGSLIIRILIMPWALRIQKVTSNGPQLIIWTGKHSNWIESNTRQYPRCPYKSTKYLLRDKQKKKKLRISRADNCENRCQLKHFDWVTQTEHTMRRWNLDIWLAVLVLLIPCSTLMPQALGFSTQYRGNTKHPSKFTS